MGTPIALEETMHNVIDFHHHWMPQEHVDHLERYIRPGEKLKVLELKDGQ